MTTVIMTSYLKLRGMFIIVAAGLIGLTGCDAGTDAVSSDAAPDSVLRQTMPKIDLHTHYYQEHPELISVLEDWNMRAALIITSSSRSLDERRQLVRELKNAHPERFILGTSFDPFRFNEPAFVDSALAKLQRDVENGAQIVKVWKNIGMEVKDDDGKYVQIDHPKFQPIWDYLAEKNIPLLAHIGEPRAAWLPLDERSPHYHYYSRHPQYHAYNLPEMPRWEEIIGARDRWVRNNPDLTIIGAHLGSMAYDVDEVAARLDSFPNFYVETAERFGDMVNQPSDKVRRFMMEYQDRVMYGTDVSTRDAELARLDTILTLHWDYLTSEDSVHFDNRKISFAAWTQGLDLPEDVLRKIYYDNAAGVIGLEPAESSASRARSRR